MEGPFRTSLIMVALTLSIYAHGQPAILWQKCLGGTAVDYGRTIRQCANGNFIFLGTTTSNDVDVSGNHGEEDLWLVSLDDSGTMLWQKCLGGTDQDLAGGGYMKEGSVEPTTDGGYFVVGSTYSNDGDVSGNHGSYDIWALKLNAAGDIEWQRCLGGTAEDRAGTGQQTSDGGYILSGTVHSINGDVVGHHGGFTDDAWVVKLDPFGNIQWQKCLGGTSTEDFGPVQQTADSGYILICTTFSNNGDVSGYHGFGDAWVVKLDNDGNIQWQKCFGSGDSEQGKSIQPTADGGYIVAIDVWNTCNTGPFNMAVLKLDQNGDSLWQACFGGTLQDAAGSAHEVNGGGYFLIGRTDSNDGDVNGNHGGNDVWLVRLNDTGAIQWQLCLGGTSGAGSVQEEAYSMLQLNDGDLVIGGTTNSDDGDVSGYHGGGSDAWIVRLSTTTGTQEEDAIGASIVLDPTGSFITISSVDGPRPSSATIIDASGRIVRSIALQHTGGLVTMEFGQQVSGLYAVQVHFTDGTRKTVRFLRNNW